MAQGWDVVVSWFENINRLNYVDLTHFSNSDKLKAATPKSFKFWDLLWKVTKPIPLIAVSDKVVEMQFSFIHADLWPVKKTGPHLKFFPLPRSNGRRHSPSCEILYWSNRRKRFGKTGSSYKIHEKVVIHHFFLSNGKKWHVTMAEGVLSCFKLSGKLYSLGLMRKWYPLFCHVD